MTEEAIAIPQKPFVDLARFREAIKWAGTVLFAIGAIAISVLPQTAESWIPFAGFAIGHAMWLGAGFLMSDKAVMALNGMYLPIDFYAIIVRL
ncbi:hypothetical protein [Azonexus hydrophilus]|uniref:Uncharacterized protein n=1 Tax=Azonexus hydrophilus TaxID=418702 RepID=A0ABZ2XPD8_9RHOO